MEDHSRHAPLKEGTCTFAFADVRCEAKSRVIRFFRTLTELGTLHIRLKDSDYPIWLFLVQLV